MLIEHEPDGSENLVLPENLRQGLGWFEQEVTRLLESEDRPDALFRATLAEAELGAVLKYITHDPTLNPHARPHGTPEEEAHAWGQVLVMISSAIVARKISLTKSLNLGLGNWQEADWRKKEARGTDRIIIGRVAYVGKASGNAFVVDDTQRTIENFQGGKILVAKFFGSDDFSHLHTFRPLGIVTDHGGITSHPAILARELCVPTIVATGNATKVIPHGAEILVDAQTDKEDGIITFVNP
jgi:phosphohistidine swiveling domain-containing protein